MMARQLNANRKMRRWEPGITGQVPLCRPKDTPYGCYLSVLTKFAGFCRIGPTQ